MPKKPTHPQAKFREDSSILMRKVSGVEIRLTTQNRLFAIFKKQIAWPYLQGSAVRFDVNNFVIPERAINVIREKLQLQARIRKEHELDFDEDESVYRFS